MIIDRKKCALENPHMWPDGLVGPRYLAFPERALKGEDGGVVFGAGDTPGEAREDLVRRGGDWDGRPRSETARRLMEWGMPPVVPGWVVRGESEPPS